MPSPTTRITESERAVATMCRRAMLTYRSAKAVGEWHPSASDTRLYPWPDKFDVPEAAALGTERATSIEVELSASYFAEPGGNPQRWPADALTVKLHPYGAAVETVISCHRSAQDTLSMAELPPDIAALLPVLRWVCRQASGESW
jgi:hypothetical protein